MSSPRTNGMLTIGPYQLTRKVGSGGMGAVYHAIDSRDGRVVALKLMHEHVASDPSYAERFRREAAVATLIDSPNVVRVLEFAADGGRPYIVTEFVDGPSVEELLREGPVAAERASAIAAGVANGLAEAARRGIVHRDIKPGNILIGPDGTPKVTDFGIATLSQSSSLTMPGMFVGTAAYAAPEQHRGEADSRSDIYSLGVVLFEMLAGSLPFQAETATGMMRQHEDARPPLERLSAQPTELVTIVGRCLEKSPARRFQDPAELAAALCGAQVKPAAVATSDTVITALPGDAFEPGMTVLEPSPRQTGASPVVPAGPLIGVRRTVAEASLLKKAAAAAIAIAAVTVIAVASCRGSSDDTTAQFASGGAGGAGLAGGATKTAPAVVTETASPSATSTAPVSPTRPPKATVTPAPATPTQVPPTPTTAPTKPPAPPVTEPPAPALALADWAFCHTAGCPDGDEELYAGYAIAVVFRLNLPTQAQVSAEVWFDGVFQYTSNFSASSNGYYFDVLPWANYSGGLELAIYAGDTYVGSAETWVN